MSTTYGEAESDKAVKRIEQQTSVLRIATELRLAVAAAREEDLQLETGQTGDGNARKKVAQLQQELYDQVRQGPMTAIEAHEFLTPHLIGAPLDLLLAVVATLDHVRRDAQGPS